MSPRYTLDGRLGGPQGQSGRGGGEENKIASLSVAVLNRGRPGRSLVPIVTSLPSSVE